MQLSDLTRRLFDELFKLGTEVYNKYLHGVGEQIDHITDKLAVWEFNKPCQFIDDEITIEIVFDDIKTLLPTLKDCIFPDLQPKLSSILEKYSKEYYNYKIDNTQLKLNDLKKEFKQWQDDIKQL